ncbi:hypothetical protein OJF2_35380 [Aquisphaera giovannonii]|uniref:Uncharacterized protein n=1 Tax=Aquisphaera giovannonii TaxID=406548 RepID=A0A5B9W2Y8_9BACT|nr:hypothetical protein [Aquisphaera giovannonii]QEH34993.1 hypothetical protein OJF2_35380 [Aquisphaera giovannonii]
MTTPRPDADLDGWLKAGLGEAPKPDFEAWRARHAGDLAALAAPADARPRRSRRALSFASRALAASLILAAGLYASWPGGDLGPKAMAGTIPGIDDPRAITWTTVFYNRATSLDGRRTWIQQERRLNAYRHPGQYRETFLDEAGKPYRVDITDAGAGRTLALDLKAKTAVLKMPVSHPDARGPFAWVGEALRDRIVARTLRVKSVSLVGRKELDGVQANVLRALIDRGDDLGYARHDFLFDAASKRLVGIWIPNENGFNLEDAPDRDKPAEEKISMWMPLGYWQREIVVDAKVKDDDFSLTPPAGFAFKAIAKPTITEAEMVAFLGAAARFNGDTFPDSPYAAFDQAKFNAASMKPDESRTPAERELIKLHDAFLAREVYRSPVLQFVEDHAEPRSFRYVGAGAKVGQADRIVAWFSPRGTTRHRALFGDLSVRDVEKSDLPMELDATATP